MARGAGLSPAARRWWRRQPASEEEHASLVDRGPSLPCMVSLATATGPASATAVTVMVLACHAGFLFAQLTGCDQLQPFQPMEGRGLFRATVDAHFNFTTHGIMMPAVAAYRLATCMGYEAHCMGYEAHDVDVCATLTCGGTAISKEVLQFSYVYSLRDLWFMPCGEERVRSGTCDQPRGGRPAALFLLLASFVWPHAKLALLLVAFHAPLRPTARRSLTWWLAALGKWSFADVLVLSVMLGVLNLRVDHALNGEVARPFAPALLSHLPSAVLSPDDLQAHLQGRLHISGLPGMYAFCVAVILSLLVGVHIEALDERHRGRSGGGGGAAAIGGGAEQQEDDSWQFGALAAAATTVDVEAGQQQRVVAAAAAATRRSRVRRWLHAILVAATLLGLVWSVNAPLFTRQVTGSLPSLLGQQSVHFDGSYSVLDLHGLVAAEGGWNHLMAATFLHMLLVGPLLRGATLLLLLVLGPPRSSRSLRGRRLLFALSRHLSVFFALEVMIVAGAPACGSNPKLAALRPGLRLTRSGCACRDSAAHHVHLRPDLATLADAALVRAVRRAECAVRDRDLPRGGGLGEAGCGVLADVQHGAALPALRLRRSAHPPLPARAALPARRAQGGAASVVGAAAQCQLVES